MHQLKKVKLKEERDSKLTSAAQRSNFKRNSRYIIWKNSNKKVYKANLEENKQL